MIQLTEEMRRLVNEAQTDTELKALRRSLNRGQPYGSEAWITQVVKKLGLESTMHSRGRPRKQK